jgi:hypothetical protein
VEPAATRPRDGTSYVYRDRRRAGSPHVSWAFTRDKPQRSLQNVGVPMHDDEVTDAERAVT